MGLTSVPRVAWAELLRLVTSRSTWGVLLLLSGAAALRSFVAVGWTAAERGGQEDPLTSGSAWGPLVDGWTLGLVLGTLVLLTHAARWVAADAESGVLRFAVTRSATRSATVLGRLLLTPLLVLAVVAVTGAAAWSVADATGDFGSLVEDGFEIFTAEELREEVERSVLAVLAPMLAVCAFGLAISCLVRGSALAPSVALGLLLAFDLFKGALGDAHYWVFAAHAPTPVDGSAWSELGGVVRGFSDAGFPDELIRVGTRVSWPAAVGCGLLACLFLRRRPL
ncbi:MAG: ABC transporter permease subunit [Planctomycetota bacterium]|jgi:hypothetical protein